LVNEHKEGSAIVHEANGTKDGFGEEVDGRENVNDEDYHPTQLIAPKSVKIYFII